MRARLVAIGNSKGVRIPRSIIEACGFDDELDMRVEGDRVVLAPARAPREGWDAAFARMAAAGDDAPLLPEPVDHDWDEREWTW